QTPTAFRLLTAEQCEESRADLRLRIVIFGGEALPFRSVRHWFRRQGTGPQLVNMYGITETTVHVTYRPLDAVDAELIDGNRIGIPIPDLEIYLLSSEQQPVADGEPGEIYVAGPGLARGYLNAPGLTGSRFVPNPFSGVPGARMYRSGDLGRRLPNGDLEFLGRIDRQVKVRAHRIEVASVETVLRSHPAIEDAFVAARADSGELAAWVTASRSHAEPVHHLVTREADSGGAGLFELPGEAAIFHVNRAETEFVSNEVFGSSCYLHHGLELREGDCVFDVGANIGVFALWAHLQAPGIRVYAFEPIVETYRILDMNLIAHGVPGRAFQCAIGSATGFTNLTHFPHVSVLSGSHSNARHGREYVRAFLGHDHGGRLDGPLLEELLDARLVCEPTACPVDTLSAMVRRLGIDTIDLLKIDVEGGEVDVLAGIDEEHWPLIGQLAIEVHDEHSLGHITDVLHGHGYRVAVDQQPELVSAGLHMVYATRGRPPHSQSPSPPRRPRVWRSPGSLARELKRHVAERMPPYMVPTSLSVVARFPLTRNGKIDADSLAGLGRRQQPAHADDALRTPIERTIAAVWQDLLGVTTLPRDANFFELGGDSILCVRMLSQLRREGYRLTPRQVFELRTLGALAAAAQPSSHDHEVAVRRTGAVPLTPIQAWFFDLRIPIRNHWNQALLLEFIQHIPVPILQRALNAMADRHDAFRLRFRRTKDQWQQSYTDAVGPVPLTRFRMADEQQAVAATHRGLDLERGPTLRAALIEGAPPRLLLVAHHLVIDALSWRVVIEDLSHAVGALLAHEDVTFPEPGATYQQWADWIARREPAPPRRPPSTPLPRDRLGNGRLESDTRRVVATLSVEETNALREPVLRSAAIGPGEVALAATASALSRWTGSRRVAIDMEGHGRDLTEELDVTRTVGWFTQFQHLALDLPTPDPLLLLSTVRRAVERERGTIGPAGESRAEVSFNYTGEIGLTNGAGGLFRIVNQTVGDLHDPGGQRPHLIDVEVTIVDGRLQSTWSYCDQVHERATIAALVADYLTALRVIGLRARYVGESQPTPLTFPLADLSSRELDRLLQIDPDPEEVYVLTPGQQGILFHSLYAPASDVYVNQFHWTFHGPFDVPAFEEGWSVAVKRHPMLRTSFAHEGLRTPHQLVHRNAPAKLELYDWRTIPGDEQESRWRDLLFEHRNRPFNSAHGLMRLVLARTGEQEHRFLWNHHHMLFDGWCTGIILRDVFAVYEALVGGTALQAALPAPARPYRDYVEWRQAQDMSEAKKFWQAHLAELPQARLLSGSGRLRPDAADGIVRQEADETVREALGDLQRATGITPHTVMVGMWALVLAELLGAPEVLFGSTVSGRTVDLDGVEDIVGLLITTLPVRARINPDVVVVDWLADLQGQLVQAREYEHVSLGEIRRWCGPPEGGPLFDTAVVFENLPRESVLRRPPPGLVISDVGSFVRNHFTFTIRTVPYPHLTFDALYNPEMVSPGWATELLDVFVGGLAALISDPYAPVSVASARVNHRHSPLAGTVGAGAGRTPKVTKAR
ncbi:MAG: FkbM family methyltransferase, partial [Pseudonocardiaceae bacterium]